VPSLNQLVSNGGSEMRLSNSRQSKDEQVFGAGNKLAAASLSQLAGEEHGQFFCSKAAEVCMQVFDATLAATFDFLFEQFGEEGFECPSFAGSGG
jgi:hypothetical protein